MGFWLLSRYFRVKIHRAPLYHLRYGSRLDSNLTNGRWKDARCIYYLWLWHPVYIYMELALQGLLACWSIFFDNSPFRPRFQRCKWTARLHCYFPFDVTERQQQQQQQLLLTPLWKIKYIWNKEKKTKTKTTTQICTHIQLKKERKKSKIF